MLKAQSDKKAWGVITLLAFIVTLFLFWWIYFKDSSHDVPWFVVYLPYINCFLNALTSLFLILGYRFIKKKDVDSHKRMMISAGVVSALFLVSYLTYHHFIGDTKFLGQGFIRPVYFFILISHIILSIVQLPCILATFYFAFTNNIEKHRKIAKVTFPIWLYVSITGILVFIVLKTFPSKVILSI